MFSNVRLNLLIKSRTYTKWMLLQNGVSSDRKNRRFYTQKGQKNTNSRQGSVEDNNKDGLFIPFKEMVATRRDEAKRSILVQVQSSQSYKELHAYCSSLGNVKQMFHYTSGVEPMHFIVVEFKNEEDAQNVISRSAYLEENQIVPVRSQFLWFRAASSRKLNNSNNNNNSSSKTGKASKNFKLNIENGTNTLNTEQLYDNIKSCKNVSEQMIMLHDNTKLNDLGVRLRFLVARQIETSISGMFPYATAFPFGSSVNGCGKMGCDLDLVLRLNEGDYHNSNNNNSRLVFHSKAGYGSERSMSQRHMETISDIVQLFLPGCAQVRRILQARVPIIKFYQQFADIECDLSMSNMSGVHMSDFLYLMTSYDPRVKPLIFTIRRWAHEVGLTNSSPGRWISNFSLTLLVLAFLQNSSSNRNPVLPTLNELIKQAEPNDWIITAEGLNCTFLRNLNRLKHPQNCSDDLQTLLLRFFEYYSQFDFDTKAVSLLDGMPITKPEHSPLYIVNPLERGLNVSKNVSNEELARFKNEIREAAWALESQEHATASSSWGILSLLQSKRNQRNAYNNVIPVRHGKLLQVSKLFEEETNTAQEIQYKNDAVKQQVENIKKEVSTKIKQLDENAKEHSSLNIVNKRKSSR